MKNSYLVFKKQITQLHVLGVTIGITQGHLKGMLFLCSTYHNFLYSEPADVCLMNILSIYI